MKPNNTPPPDIMAVRITGGRLTFDLEDGRTVSVPLTFYPTLQFASRSERSDFEICRSSVHWPKLDCDISSACLLRGARESRRFAVKALRKRGLNKKTATLDRFQEVSATLKRVKAAAARSKEQVV